MYRNNYVQQPQQNFNVKIYKGDNSISLAKNDSALLSSVQNSPKDPLILASNMEQFLSYHLIRLVSDSFEYLDPEIYKIINNYVSSLNILEFLNKQGGKNALVINIQAEFYKIAQLLYYYQKPLLVEIDKVREEIGVLVDKMIKTM